MHGLTTVTCLLIAFAVANGASLKNSDPCFKLVEHKQHRHDMNELEPELASTIFNSIHRNPLARTTTVKPVTHPKSPTVRGKRSTSHEETFSALNEFTSIDRVAFLGNDDPFNDEYDTLNADFDLDLHPATINKPDAEKNFSVTAPAILDELETITESSNLPTAVTRKVIDEEPAIVTGEISEALETTTTATTENTTVSAEDVTDVPASDATTSKEETTSEAPTTITTSIAQTTLLQEINEIALASTSTSWPEVVVIKDSMDAKPEATTRNTVVKSLKVIVPAFDLSDFTEHLKTTTPVKLQSLPPKPSPPQADVKDSSDNILPSRSNSNRKILDSTVFKRRNIVSNDIPPAVLQKFFRRLRLQKKQKANEFRQVMIAKRSKRAADEYDDYDSTSQSPPKANENSETLVSTERNTDVSHHTTEPEKTLTAAEKLALIEEKLSRSKIPRRGLITGKTVRTEETNKQSAELENGRTQIRYVENERPVVSDPSTISILPTLVLKKPPTPLRDNPNDDKKSIVDIKPIRVLPKKPVTQQQFVPAPRPIPFQAPIQQFQPQFIFPRGPHYPPVQVFQQPFAHPQIIQRPVIPPVSIDHQRAQISILPVPTPKPRRLVTRQGAVHSGDVVKDLGQRVKHEELNIVRIYQHFGTTKQAFHTTPTTPVPTTTETPTTTTTERPKWVGITFSTHPTPDAPFDESLVSTPAPQAKSHIRTSEFDLYDEVSDEHEHETTTTKPTLTTPILQTTTTEEVILTPKSAEKFVQSQPETFPAPGGFDYITDEEIMDEKSPKPVKQQAKLVKFADNENIKAFPARDFTGNAPEAHLNLNGFSDKIITSIGLP